MFFLVTLVGITKNWGIASLRNTRNWDYIIVPEINLKISVLIKSSKYIFLKIKVFGSYIDAILCG